MSSPSLPPKTFTVTVEGIGDFAFRRRTIGDDIKIAVAYERLTGGIGPSPMSFLDHIASALATYRVLAASWPSPEWAPELVEQMDTLADNRTADLARIFGAFSAREDEFRPAAKRRSEEAGKGEGGQPGDVVQAKIQPTAD